MKEAEAQPAGRTGEGKMVPRRIYSEEARAGTQHVDGPR